MKFYRNYLLSICAIALSACASNPAKVDFPVDTNPQTKVNELRDRMKSDQAQQYDELSPSNFEQAGKSLREAQNKIAESKPSNEILQDAANAAASLQIVEANGAAHATQLSPILTARQAAIAAQARETWPQDFKSVDSDFVSYGHDIENGNFHPDSTDISKLQAKYSDLELKSVEQAQLGEVRDIMKKADNRDGHSKAPMTFDAAEAKYNSALRSIEANRRNPVAYQAAVKDSVVSARKLDQVLNTMDNSKSSEAAAVKIYDQQQQIAATQQSLTQSEAQTAAANQQTAAAQTQIMADQQAEATLQGQNAQYASKAAEEQKIVAIKAEFQPSEADVLRDGNKIILRLKSMKFSTSRFELTDSSLGTLQKVKEMIAAVPFSMVKVEGHTDSVGGEQRNLELSQKRAETVKKYLVAENSVPADKIEAQGFGYSRPLVSNKTAQDRATNRRVDVIIDTTLQP